MQPELKAWIEVHRKFFDVILDAYCIVDSTNQVVEFNTAFSDLCGESYRKILKIGGFCQILKIDGCPEDCPARRAFVTEGPVRLDEVGATTKGEASLKLILSTIPIFSARGKALGAFVNIRNVSAETELQKKYDERKRESVTDGLTKLVNKVNTEQALVRMMKNATRENQAISLMLCDIDHFKKVNDTYGHQAGDHVLSVVAGILKDSVRETDLVGRFGGEEFVALLAKCDVEGVLVFAERFRDKIQNTRIEFEGKHIPVTVSLGTATFQKAYEAGLDFEASSKELIGHADVALYFAKANGRNQRHAFEKLPADVQGAGIPQKKKAA